MTRISLKDFLLRFGTDCSLTQTSTKNFWEQKNDDLRCHFFKTHRKISKDLHSWNRFFFPKSKKHTTFQKIKKWERSKYSLGSGSNRYKLRIFHVFYQKSKRNWKCFFFSKPFLYFLLIVRGPSILGYLKTTNFPDMLFNISVFLPSRKNVDLKRISFLSF